MDKNSSVKKISARRRFLIVLASIVGAIILVAGGYLAYVSIQYYRIPDNTALEVKNPRDAKPAVGKDYTALTYNVGFGAYTTDFSFFMDEGVMKDGTAVKGTGSRAASKETVLKNIGGAADTVAGLNPDFCLFQEVDIGSTRSFKVDESALLSDKLSERASTLAVNFHSAYLFYPISAPHGASNSGLLTLSRYGISEAFRRSYPVDNSWPTKFFDLDRAFSVNYVPVEGGKQLVLINSHMSAYDEGGVIRAQQMKLLTDVLSSEAAKGNYVICGGDFNHAFPGMLTKFPSQQEVPKWVQAFDTSLIPKGFGLVMAENAAEVPTCRSTDMKYTKSVNFETVLDGFIVSDNVRASAKNVDTGYEYSDHNPVILTFSLK